jgi:sulfate transport system ATP-binding protein
MNKGKIEQVGTPEEVYHNPANSFVLNFLGNVNLFHGRVEEGKVFVDEKTVESSNAKPASLYVRPHQFQITRQSKDQSSFKATINFINPAGAAVKLDLTTDSGKNLQAEIPQEEFRVLKLKKGEEVYVSVKDVTYTEFEI